MTGDDVLPVGKLPPELLGALLSGLPAFDSRLVIRPGIGEDIAAIDFDDRFLVVKTDPITFAADHQGWYLANVNANDIATSGALPKWCLVTALLPEGKTTKAVARELFTDLTTALSEMGVTLCGGHTEITYGLDRPILVGFMMGEVAKDRLVDKKAAQPGDVVLITKWVPIEGASIIAREKADALKGRFSEAEIERAAGFLFDPGISILPEAMAATKAGAVHAMHDITEGGVATGLVELAVSTGTGIVADADRIPIPDFPQRLCDHLGLDPLGVISSGSLLLAVDPGDAEAVIAAVHKTGTDCREIGRLTDRPGQHVLTGSGGPSAMPTFKTDEISKLFA